MKIKSLLISLALGAGLTASSLFANSVVLTSTGFNGGPGSDLAGEFLATTSDNGSFITFCLEEFVHVDLDKAYSYTLGGPIVLDQGDTISEGTAWLYESFIKGTLVGYAPDDATHNTNAGVLQKAFWTLEDEFDWSPNAYVDLAVAHFGSLAAAKADYTGSTVEVMNLWGPEREDVQSVLHLVPDSGVSVALLGLGMLSLAFVRRKL